MDDQERGQAPTPTSAPRRTRSVPGGYRYGVGRVLGRTFSVYGRYFLPLVLLSAVLHAPIALWVLSALSDEAIAGADTQAQRDSLASKVRLLALIASVLIPIFIQVVVTHATFQALSGSKSSMAQSVRAGFNRYLPALGVTIVYAILTSGVAFIAQAVDAPGLLAIGGLVAAVVGCIYFVCVQVCVVERTGVAASLSRSAQLTRGSRFGIFLTLLVFYLMVFVGVVVLAIAFVDLEGLPDFPGLAEVRTEELLGLAFGAVIAPLTAVCAAVVYYDLRVGKEGVVAQDLARVFE